MKSYILLIISCVLLCVILTTRAKNDFFSVLLSALVGLGFPTLALWGCLEGSTKIMYISFGIVAAVIAAVLFGRIGYGLCHLFHIKDFRSFCMTLSVLGGGLSIWGVSSLPENFVEIASYFIFIPIYLVVLFILMTQGYTGESR